MVEQEAVNFEVAGSSPVPGAIQVKTAQIGHFSCSLVVVDALRKKKKPSWAVLILNGCSSGAGREPKVRPDDEAREYRKYISDIPSEEERKTFA